MSEAVEAAEAPAPAKRPAPWRGRRRVPDPKDKFIAVRCTLARHAAYTAAAAEAGLSVGAYLRFCADGSPGPRAVRRPPVEKEALARLLGEIGKLGSNVNQIAHAVNTSGDLPSWHELHDITSEVHAMRAALMKALGHGD